VAVAVVVKQFAHGGSPNASVLGAAIELLADPTTNSSVHKAGLRPLSAVLEISDARRALAAISTSAVVQEGSTLRRVISDHQRRIERKAGDERDIATFRAKPELLLIDLFRRDQPRYKTERTMPKVWKDAALIAANEREGQTLYEELIKHAATPTLERVRLSGSTVGFRGTVVHDEGGRRNVTLVVIADTGPKAAAAVIPDILDSGPLGILLFVGCAGEISEKHRSSTTKRLVIVARQIVDRDPSVVAPSGLKFGMRGYPASDELLSWVRSLVVSKSFPGLDVRTDKDVASGTSFVSDEGSEEYKALVGQFGSEIVAVEMEGAGGFHLIRSQIHKAPGLIYGMIKAFSDKADPAATIDKDARQRAATAHAATVAFRVLQTLDS